MFYLLASHNKHRQFTPMGPDSQTAARFARSCGRRWEVCGVPMDEAEKIKELRHLSGAGLLKCKKVLERCGGDLDRALAELQERGDGPPEPEPEIID